MGKERDIPKFELITREERLRRDPRGLARVTLSGDNFVVIKKGKLPEKVESNEEPKEEGEQ